MIRVILIAVLATFILSDSASAQQQNRRGRFFQRVKKELFGDKPSTPTPSKKTDSAKSPTPSKNQSKYSATPPRNGQSKSYTNSSPQRKKSSGSKDFGFEITQNSSDQLVVSRIEPRGNAADAGLTRGDRIIEIGGIEANSVEEFDEISKVMNGGDQMEFKIKRNGLTKTLLITYGQPPEIDEKKIKEMAATDKDRRYDFAPPKSNRSSNSVLDAPAPAAKGGNTHSISSQRNFTQHRFTDQDNSNNAVIQQMREIIQRQNEQIRQLQSEVANLKRFGR